MVCAAPKCLKWMTKGNHDIVPTQLARRVVCSRRGHSRLKLLDCNWRIRVDEENEGVFKPKIIVVSWCGLLVYRCQAVVTLREPNPRNIISPPLFCGSRVRVVAMCAAQTHKRKVDSMALRTECWDAPLNIWIFAFATSSREAMQERRSACPAQE